jgi:hypothetical protein
MQFNPAIHTKEFLLNNSKVLFELAEKSVGFSVSALASDLDLLRLGNNNGWTVAHELSIHHPEWIETEGSKNFEVLRLADNDGRTIAHWLAQCQSEWIHSEAAKNLEIISMNSAYGSVALYLVIDNKDCIYHEPLMQKQVLTIEHRGKVLAEEIAERYTPDGFNVSAMAMKLISQGAAYKHSESIEFTVGQEILKQCLALIEDNLEPAVTFKQLQSLYSTFSHNVTKIRTTQVQESSQKWQELLNQSENLIRQHLNDNPSLYDKEHTVDIFCEPAEVLLKKLQSERHLSAIQYSINTADIEPIKQAIY